MLLLCFHWFRCPTLYEVTTLPIKLPPIKQPLSIVSLPMLGYMEQSVATPIINALTAVGCCKPKFPFITATQSALLYVALHLKGEVYLYSSDSKCCLLHYNTFFVVVFSL